MGEKEGNEAHALLLSTLWERARYHERKKEGRRRTFFVSPLSLLENEKGT